MQGNWLVRETAY